MNRSLKIVIALAIIGLVGVLVYINTKKWHHQKVDKAVSEERQQWAEKTESLNKKVATLKQELKALDETGPTDDRMVEVIGPSKSRQETDAPPPIEKEIESQILAFFKYIDQQPYAKPYIGPQGTYGRYQESIERLSQRLPLLTGETEDLDRLASNMAHFYRVLKKERITLFIRILQNEADILEPIARKFFAWYTTDNPSAFDLKGRPSEKMQYTYAAFFLNTLAGRSYLLRRDSRIRNIAYFYCVQVLDRANDARLNSLGIDIRPHIKNIYRDIQFQRGLAERRIYLTELDRLYKKYDRSDKGEETPSKDRGTIDP